MLTESWQTWEGIFLENWEWVKDNNRKKEGTIGVFDIILLSWCCTQFNLHYSTYIVNSLKMSQRSSRCGSDEQREILKRRSDVFGE